MCNIEQIKGAIAEIPVNIKNTFNFPFCFLAINVSIMPSIRSISPNIAINGKNTLSIDEGNGIRKQVNKRMKTIIKE